MLYGIFKHFFKQKHNEIDFDWLSSQCQSFIPNLKTLALFVSDLCWI